MPVASPVWVNGPERVVTVACTVTTESATAAAAAAALKVLDDDSETGVAELATVAVTVDPWSARAPAR